MSPSSLSSVSALGSDTLFSAASWFGVAATVEFPYTSLCFMLCEDMGLSRGGTIIGINLCACFSERRRLRKRYVAAQKNVIPTAIPIAMQIYAAFERLLGCDAAGIGEGLLTGDDGFLGVKVVAMVLGCTLLFWVAAPL
jgi:hypothetical protein